MISRMCNLKLEFDLDLVTHLCFSVSCLWTVWDTVCEEKNWTDCKSIETQDNNINTSYLIYTHIHRDNSHCKPLTNIVCNPCFITLVTLTCNKYMFYIVVNAA